MARVRINRVRLPILFVVSWTGKINISLSLFAPENLVSRDRFGSPVPRQPAHLHTQAAPGSHLRDSFRVPRRRLFIYIKPSYAIGSVPSSSGHAVAYRWRSLPKVRRRRSSKPQGSFKRVLPWQVTMEPLICASLSQTPYWYEVGMLKVPRGCRIRYGDAKPCAPSSDHLHYLSQLLGRLRADPDIVSLTRAPKRRRQNWLAGSCFPPPPRPLFLHQSHPSVHDSFIHLETRVGHVYNCREEDVSRLISYTELGGESWNTYDSRWD